MKIRNTAAIIIVLGFALLSYPGCQKEAKRPEVPKKKKIIQKKVAKAAAKKHREKAAKARARKKTKKAAAKPAKVATSAPSQATQSTKGFPELKPEPEYVYDPRGKPDPFKPLQIAVARPAPRAITRTKCPPGPLTKSEIQQFKVVGILRRGTGKEKVLIEDATGKGFMIRVGTCIGKNGGRVFKITRDGILIEEFYIDIYGNEKRRVISLKLKP